MSAARNSLLSCVTVVAAEWVGDLAEHCVVCRQFHVVCSAKPLFIHE
jgi:hypothetical protein